MDKKTKMGNLHIAKVLFAIFQIATMVPWNRNVSTRKVNYYPGNTFRPVSQLPPNDVDCCGKQKSSSPIY